MNLFGYGEIPDPSKMDFYLSSKSGSILYLSFGFLFIGLIHYLKFFIFTDSNKIKKIGLLIILPFLIMSLINFTRLFKINGLTIYDIWNISDYRSIRFYFVFNVLYEISALIFYGIILKKNILNDKKKRLVRFFLILIILNLVISSSSVLATNIGYLTANTFFFTVVQQILFIITDLLQVVYALGILSLYLHYQLISFKMIRQRLFYFFILVMFIMFTYSFIIFPAFNSRSDYSQLISRFGSGFFLGLLILGIIWILQKNNNYLELFFYFKNTKKLEDFLLLNSKLLTIINTTDLERTLNQLLVKQLKIENLAFYINKGNSNKLELLFTNQDDLEKNFSNHSKIVNELLLKGDIIYTEENPFLDKFHFAIPVFYQEQLLAILLISQRNYSQTIDEDDLQIIRYISANIGVCLENINLNQRLLSQKMNILQREIVELKSQLKNIPPDDQIIGKSLSIKKLLAESKKIAETDASVLINGENGTGKELVARYIHNNSIRKEKDFVSINCAAIPENLLESELFGYEKGAFSGAVSPKKGKLEIAHKGTLFLDEIGELTSNMQAKLLRVLQEKKITHLGGNKEIDLDFRLLCATNRNLGKMIENGDFREDLYYRIKVISIYVPALREHSEDIPMLIEHFISQANIEHKKSIKGLQKEALEKLSSYSWPGNIRQLKNTIEAAVILASTDNITIKDLPTELREKPATQQEDRLIITDLEKQIFNYEKNLIIEALQKNNGVKTKAAQFLKITRDKLNYLLKKHQL